MSLSEKIRTGAKTAPQRIALDDGLRRVSYGELQDAISLHARMIRDAGCKRLAIAGDNGVDWILWDLAALQEDIPCVPLPPFFTQAQKDFTLSSAGVTHLAHGQALVVTRTSGFPELPRKTAKITFTSGSTGAPKGVCLTQAGMENVAKSIGAVLGEKYAGVHLCVLPLSILLENIAGVYTALTMGASIHVPPLSALGMENPFAPDFKKFLEALDETKATSAILVPELLRGLTAAVAAGQTKVPHLEFLAVGGAKVAPGLIAQARALGLPVYEGYGLSECGSVVSLNTPETQSEGTAGKLLPHIRAQIVDGEIIIEDPAFAGYLGERPRTAGSYATGDIGTIDAEGFVTLQGRRKNVIITGFGRNISPEWVESHLLAQDAIAQAVVYGDGAAHLGALIVPALPGANIRDAIAAANKDLPGYAQVGNFCVVPAFTRGNGMLTGNGRINRDFILRTYGKDKNMTFYDRLNAETAAQRHLLYSVPQLTDALKGNISHETYIAYLTEAYHHVSHTVRFLMSMGARLPEEKKWLHDAIAEYIDEEKGHEEWILNDIAAAGGDKEAARRARPNLETQVLVAYNYDYIARKNPVGFLGMVFMLESTSVQIATSGAESIQKGLGLPKSAFTYLTSHGALDIEHMKFFERLVNKIDDPADQAAIIEVAQNTFCLFAGVLGAIPHSGARKNAA